MKKILMTSFYLLFFRGSLFLSLFYDFIWNFFMAFKALNKEYTFFISNPNSLNSIPDASIVLSSGDLKPRVIGQIFG